MIGTGPHLTPAAIYHGNPEPGSEPWVVLRRAGITGTDVVAIVGESRRDNARTVWHTKRGDVIERRPADEELSEAALWGTLLEPTVAAEWARRHSVAIADGGIFVNSNAPWMRAQVDRLVATCPDRDDQDTLLCALEVKTRNAFVAGKWRTELPDDVLAQAAWQRAVTGLDHIHVACLVGGQRLIEHTYVRDDRLEEWLAAAAWGVWECVQEDRPPEVDWDAIMVELLDALAPDRSGTREMTRDEYVTLMAEWRAKQECERQALLAKARVDGKIKAAMGDGDAAVEVLTFEREPVFTWKAGPRAGYTVAPNPSVRRLIGPPR